MNSKEANRILGATNASVRKIDSQDFAGYNEIAGGGVLDFFTGDRQQTQIRDSYAMWVKNPLAKFIIDIMLDFTWSGGIVYKAKEPIVQTLLDDYYNDVDNDWGGEKGDQRIQDLSIYGELFLKNFVSDNAGKVKVSSIFPGSVLKVVVDPENSENIKSIFVTKADADPKELDIIKWNELTKTYEGDVTFYKINSTVHQPRGISDLFVRRDWLRLYDKSLYSTMDRVGLMLSFVWDVTMENAKESELKKKKSKIINDPPRPGSVRVHNEKEVWKEVSPDIKGGDFDAIYRLLRSQAMGGIPEHYWGLGGDVNLASAKEMAQPFFKKMKRRQKLIRSMFRTQFDFVIHSAKAKNMFPQDTDTSYTLSMSDPDDKNADRFADTILKFAQSLTILETNNYISADEVDSVIGMLFELIGVETASGDDQEELEDKNKSKDDNDDKKLENIYNKFSKKIRGKK